ncbi:MAG: phosphonate ABC transporter ATP-binding protein [Thermomicrobiales bacterium]
MTTRGDPLIIADGLGVSFPAPSGSCHVTALEDLSLVVREGEFLAVIGPSGAGKTTLLRACTGFARPSTGRLEVLGVDVARAGADELYGLRRNVAMIFQQYHLVERATALENVVYGRLGHVSTLRSLFGVFQDGDRRRAYDVLAELGLAHRATQRVDRLSGGERQRVAVARALMQEPRIVLADEPAASLDVSLAQFVLETLQAVNRERGVTVLVNLHDVELAMQFATRVVALQRGRLFFDGTPDHVTPKVLATIYGGRQVAVGSAFSCR